MAEVFTDLASSTLASGISLGATSLTVQTGDGALFPTPTGGDFFRVFLFKKATGESEFVTCSARSTDVFTISATTRAYNAGDVVELRPSSAFFNNLAAGADSTNIQQGIFSYSGTDTGGTDVYVFAMNPTATAYVAGMVVNVVAGSTNTGACTLKLDALAAVAIKVFDGTDPPAGAIQSGFMHTFEYNGTNWILRERGLIFTGASGYNALGRKITNVAAGTGATDVATIGGTETLTNKTLTSPALTTPAITTPTINSVRGYGVVILDTPDQLLTGSATVGTWTQYDMSAGTAAAQAAATAGAVKIILRVQTTVNVTSVASLISIVYAQKNGLGGSIGGGNVVAFSRATDENGSAPVNQDNSVTEVIINLDSNSDFEYQTSIPTVGGTGSYTIFMVGYYV